ncbi:unnamed protein product [Polarella glacialis]|uniref:Uncharacterized protein n=1 Tax=Polarella glacialis TaxID=89957 RepID=A0A813L1E6_POLGL|nr:unnamed protein product [Polarella glacialis]
MMPLCFGATVLVWTSTLRSPETVSVSPLAKYSSLSGSATMTVLRVSISCLLVLGSAGLRSRLLLVWLLFACFHVSCFCFLPVCLALLPRVGEPCCLAASCIDFPDDVNRAQLESSWPLCDVIPGRLQNSIAPSIPLAERFACSGCRRFGSACCFQVAKCVFFSIDGWWLSDYIIVVPGMRD